MANAPRTLDTLDGGFFWFTKTTGDSTATVMAISADEVLLIRTNAVSATEPVTALQPT